MLIMVLTVDEWTVLALSLRSICVSHFAWKPKTEQNRTQKQTSLQPTANRLCKVTHCQACLQLNGTLTAAECQPMHRVNPQCRVEALATEQKIEMTMMMCRFLTLLSGHEHPKDIDNAVMTSMGYQQSHIAVDVNSCTILLLWNQETHARTRGVIAFKDGNKTRQQSAWEWQVMPSESRNGLPRTRDWIATRRLMLRSQC